MSESIRAEMHRLEVGKPYNASRSSQAIRGANPLYPEGAQYNYRGGQHELVFFFPNPSGQETLAIRKGSIEFAVAYEEGVVFLLYQVGTHPDTAKPYSPASGRKQIPWSDAPYSWWLVPEEERQLPNPEPGNEERELLTVILVEASRGLVQVIRVISLPPAVSAALNNAIRDQASKPFPGQREYDAAIARVYKRYPDTLGMVRDARARGKGGV